MWVIEFQERGAPHFHMICGAPKGVEDRELRDWGFNAWTALLVKDGLGYAEADAIHHWRMMLRFNVSSTWWMGASAPEEIANYLWRESGKARQKTVPEGYVNLGRFWGFLGKRVAVDRRELCCEAGYIEFRRLVRALRGPGDSHAERKALRTRLYRAQFRDLERGEDGEELKHARQKWTREREWGRNRLGRISKGRREHMRGGRWTGLLGVKDFVGLRDRMQQAAEGLCPEHGAGK
jgi:hypothetical protein